MFSPNSSHSSHDYFDAYPSVFRANVLHFRGVDMRLPSIGVEDGFLCRNPNSYDSSRSLCGVIFLHFQSDFSRIDSATAQDSLLCRTITRKQQSRLNCEGRSLNC